MACWRDKVGVRARAMARQGWLPGARVAPRSLLYLTVLINGGNYDNNPAKVRGAVRV